MRGGDRRRSALPHFAVIDENGSERQSHEQRHNV